MRSLAQVIVLASLLFFFAVGAIPTKKCAYAVKEKIEAPRGWVKHSKPHPGHRIALRIGFPQHNFNQLEKHLYEVSDPDHERYGQHLSKAEVEQLVAPHQESVDSVNEWLFSFGLTEDDLVKSPAADWVTIKVPISLAEKMLDTVEFIDSDTICHNADTLLISNITFGNIAKVAIISFELQVIASQITYTTTSTSSNRPQCLEDLRNTNPQYLKLRPKMLLLPKPARASPSWTAFLGLPLMPAVIKLSRLPAYSNCTTLSGMYRQLMLETLSASLAIWQINFPCFLYGALTFDTGTIREHARSSIILCRPEAGRFEFQLQTYIS